MADERILRIGVKIDEALQSLGLLERKFKSTGDAAKKVNEEATKTQSVFSKLAGSMRTLGGTTVFAGLIFQLGKGVNAALELDEKFSILKSNVKNTGAEIKKLEEGLRKVSEYTGESQLQLADSLVQIKRAGFDGAAAIEMLNYASSASEAGFGKTEDIARAATAAINNYGAANLDAGTAIGVLVKAIQSGGLNITTLDTAIGRTAPLAAELGVQFYELAGAFTFLEKRGIQASQAGFALQTMLQTMSAPADNAAKVLKRNNIEVKTLRDTLANQGLAPALAALRDGLKGNRSEITALFPGARSLSAVLALMDDDAGGLTSTMDDLARATGQDVNTAFDRTNNSARELKKGLNSLNNIFMEIGKDWLPILVTISSGFATVLGSVKTFGENLGRIFAEITIPDFTTDLITSLEQGLRKAEIARSKFNEIPNFSQADKDKQAQAWGFPSEAAVTEAIKTYKTAIEQAKKDLGIFNKSFISDVSDALKTQSAVDYRKSLEAIVSAHNGRGLNKIRGLFYTDEEVADAKGRLFALDHYDEEIFQNMLKRRGQLDSKPPRIPPKQGPTTPTKITLESDEESKINSLIKKYDEFDTKVRDLRESFTLLQKGVAAGAISAKTAQDAYNGLVLDIADSATNAATFAEAIKNSRVAVDLLSNSVKSHGGSVEAVRTAQEGMLDSLAKFATSADTFAGKVDQTKLLVTELSRAVGANGASSEFARLKVKGLVEALADGATASGVFKESVINGNVVLKLMASLVSAGALSIENARRIYKELGEEIVSLGDSTGEAAKAQAAWNRLLDTGITPTEKYEITIKNLVKDYLAVVEAGHDATRAQQLLNESIKNAGQDLQDAITKLTPEQKKLQTAIERVSQASANAFSDMIQDASSFNDVLKGLLKTILDVITQLLIVEPLKNALTQGLTTLIPSFGSTPSGTPAGGAYTGATVGKAGGGGIVAPAKRYLVGEEGAELLISNSDRTRAIMVGKNGPEHIITPPGGGTIISNRETRQLLGEGTIIPFLKRFESMKDELTNPPHRAAGGQIGGHTAEIIRPIQFNKQADQPAQVNTIINIQNNTGQEVTQTKRQDTNGIDVIDIVIGAVTRNIDDRGSVSKSIDRRNRLIRR